MRQDFGEIFPAETPLPELNMRLEERGYRIERTQYIPQGADRAPGQGLPDEEGLCEVRAYGGPGLDPVLMLVYSRGTGVPVGCLFSPQQAGQAAAG